MAEEDIKTSEGEKVPEGGDKKTPGNTETSKKDDSKTTKYLTQEHVDSEIGKAKSKYSKETESEKVKHEATKNELEELKISTSKTEEDKRLKKIEIRERKAEEKEKENNKKELEVIKKDLIKDAGDGVISEYVSGDTKESIVESIKGTQKVAKRIEDNLIKKLQNEGKLKKDDPSPGDGNVTPGDIADEKVINSFNLKIAKKS